MISSTIRDKFDLVVVRALAGAETTLTLDSDYTVTLNADQDGNPGTDVNFVVTPNGTAVPIPEGYVGEVTENGEGLVFRPEGSVGRANSIRVMDPNPRNPGGYVRIYNANGQPLTPTGQVGPNSATHIPWDYQGPVNWPRTQQFSNECLMLCVAAR